MNIRETVEYKIERLRHIYNEIKNRMKYPYYNYIPLRLDPDDNCTENKYKYLDFHRCGKKIRILEGSPRSGKTTMAIQDVCWLALGEHPFIKLEVPNIGWVIVQKFEKLWEPGGMIDKFEERLPLNRIKAFVKNKKDREYWIEFDNGSKIVFKSEEQGIDSFTSVKIHWALKDERIYNEQIRKQLRMRIVDENGYLIYTMDKLEEDDWVYELRNKDYVFIGRYEFKDNPKLPPEEANRIANEVDEIDKEILLYGKFKERNHQLMFPPTIWNESNYVEIIPKRFDVIGGDIVPNEAGFLRVFKEKQDNMNYVIAWDVSEGIGKNATAIGIFDETGEQIAVWFSNIYNYELLAKNIIMPLGEYYNNALAAGELKGCGFAVMSDMKKLGYKNLYVDVINQQLKQTTQLSFKFGIVTDPSNKSQMVAQTKKDLENGKLLLHCEMTKIQFEHFVKEDRGETKTHNGIFYHGTKIRGCQKYQAEFKYSDDDLVMMTLFADRVLNGWGYLDGINRKTKRQEEEKSKIQTIDDLYSQSIIYTNADDEDIDQWIYY